MEEIVAVAKGFCIFISLLMILVVCFGKRHRDRKVGYCRKCGRSRFHKPVESTVVLVDNLYRCQVCGTIRHFQS